jgi:hypothetical protein
VSIIQRRKNGEAMSNEWLMKNTNACEMIYIRLQLNCFDATERSKQESNNSKNYIDFLNLKGGFEVINELGIIEMPYFPKKMKHKSLAKFTK